MPRAMKAGTDLADAVDTAEAIPLLHRETTAAADITADTEAACAAAIMPDAVITVAVATMVGVVIMAWVSGSAFMRLTAMLLRHATLRGFMTRMAAGKPIRAAQFPTDINALAASIVVLVTRGNLLRQTKNDVVFKAAPRMKRQCLAGECFYFKSSVLMLMESATSHDIGSKVARAEHARICGTASGFLVMASKSSRLFHWA
jgi:hypothetical protein